MTGSRLLAAAFLTVGLAVLCVVSVSSDAFAAAAAVVDSKPAAFSILHAAQLVLAVGLDNLRGQHAELVTRAAAKIAEVKDGLPAADVTRIEGEHGALLRDVSAVADAIKAEERKAPVPGPTDPNRAHAWSGEDAKKIGERAKAFGLSGEDAIAVMADPKVRSLEAATDNLQERAVAKNGPRQTPQIDVTRDEGDTLRNAVESSVMLRANPASVTDAKLIEQAREYRGMSLLEAGRHFIERSQGVKLRGLSRRELATVCLGLPDMSIRIAGMHSTSDFANVLANVASKRLRAAYEAAPQTFKRFTRPSTNPDFKEKSVVQLSSSPAFKKVREGAEYSHGGLTDGVEKYALATYGRIIAITRQALMNDDLGAFDRLPRMLGRAAADLESNTVWNILLDNAAMNDTVALFHADHGNLLSATAIDETNLALAEKAMRDQKGLAAKAADRENLNLTPAFMMVGNAKKIQAQKMLTAVQATATSGVNPFAGAMELIVEARITGNKWFLSASPDQIDTIEYSYLEGENGVFIEQRVGFEVDGLEVKGRLDFAAKAIDWRGLTYNPGA